MTSWVCEDINHRQTTHYAVKQAASRRGSPPSWARESWHSIWWRHSLRGVSKVGVVPVPLLWHNKPPQNSAAWNRPRLPLRAPGRGRARLQGSQAWPHLASGLPGMAALSRLASCGTSHAIHPMSAEAASCEDSAGLEYSSWCVHVASHGQCCLGEAVNCNTSMGLRHSQCGSWL